MAKKITSNSVVDAITSASTPQQRSAATRLLNGYVKQQVSLGKTEAGVRASIKGRLTRLQQA